MAETKPMTTGGLLGEDKKNDAKRLNEGASTSGRAQESAGVSAAKPPQQASKPATTQSDEAASAGEVDAKPGDPCPTQAELDAMRESSLRGGQRRDAKAGEDATAKYKTR